MYCSPPLCARPYLQNSPAQVSLLFLPLWYYHQEHSPSPIPNPHGNHQVAGAGASSGQNGLGAQLHVPCLIVLGQQCPPPNSHSVTLHMEEALLYVDLKTSRKKVVLCPFPFPNFPLPWFTCVTRYRMYWTRRLSPDLLLERCSSLHWIRGNHRPRATGTRSTGCATLAPRHRKIRGALY